MPKSGTVENVGNLSQARHCAEPLPASRFCRVKSSYSSHCLHETPGTANYRPCVAREHDPRQDTERGRSVTRTNLTSGSRRSNNPANMSPVGTQIKYCKNNPRLFPDWGFIDLWLAERIIRCLERRNTLSSEQRRGPRCGKIQRGRPSWGT